MPYIDSRQKIFWHLDHLQQLRATGKTKAPVNVEIDLSNRCSHGCSWCHFAYTHTRGPLAGKREKPADDVPGGDLMSMALAYSIIDQLRDTGVKSVTWTGGGEPTLHPDFDDIIAYTHGRGLEQGIYTHGGHINVRRAALLKQNMTWVYVSLDECTRERFEQSKGVDRFKAVIDGARSLVLAEGPATIGLGFLLHKGNYHLADDMANLGRSLGVDYIQFRPVIAYCQEQPGRLAEDTEWVSGVIVRLKHMQDTSQVIVDYERMRLYRDWQTHGYDTCHWSALQTAITPNGKVWRCANKREHADALLGDLSVEPFADLWARSGGTCKVDDRCRVMCRGHLSNLTLDAVMREPAHKEFI